MQLTRCKHHPAYKGVRKPYSARPGCTCWDVYFLAFLRRTAKEVSKWPRWMREGVGTK